AGSAINALYRIDVELFNVVEARPTVLVHRVSFGCGYFRTTDNHQENQMVRMILPVADGGFGRGYEDNPGFCDQLRCLDWADLAWCRKMVCESFSRRLSRVFSFRYCREAA